MSEFFFQIILNFAIKISDFHSLIMIFSILVPPCPHQEEGVGKHQVEVYRHQLQDGSWTFPNTQGQNGLYGTPQKGCCQDGGRCINIFLLSISREKDVFSRKISKIVTNRRKRKLFLTKSEISSFFREKNY